jgi:hypothetical protein
MILFHLFPGNHSMHQIKANDHIDVALSQTSHFVVEVGRSESVGVLLKIDTTVRTNGRRRLKKTRLTKRPETCYCVYQESQCEQCPTHHTRVRKPGRVVQDGPQRAPTDCWTLGRTKALFLLSAYCKPMERTLVIRRGSVAMIDY